MEMARTEPRAAWALAAVADAAASHHSGDAGDVGDRRLQALAAFNLARAANALVQPERVWEAAQRARALFAGLGDRAWAAACDWQYYAVPWACNDFSQAAATLQQALAELDSPETAQWQVECRLSLAFARILRTDLEGALEHIDICERYYRQLRDVQGLVQALNHKAACLRRQWRFDAALATAQEALDLLATQPLPLERARTHFQLGSVQVLQGTDYQSAEAHLTTALALFDAAGVELWSAQCHYALARLFRETGRVADAARALRETRRTFRRFPIIGLRADALLDSAIFALRSGEARQALAFVDEAEPLYRQLEVWYLAATSNLYRGEIYAELGRYQLALHYMELAHTWLREMDLPDRVAEASLRLGEVWLWLDRAQEALSYLQQAADFYEETGHMSFLAETYSLLTAARLRNGDDVSEIIADASAALRRLEPHGVQPYLALLQRFSGEAYLASGQPERALLELQEAVEKFRSMSMDVEVAECYLPLGHCHRLLERPQDAANAYREALSLTQASLPGITWRAQEGLAGLAAASGDTAQALDHYEAMVAAFGRLRRWFWQPALAGAYLNRSAQALDSAVAFAGAHRSPLLLRFVEESKAQTVKRRLSANDRAQDTISAAGSSDRQQELAEEIRWLQQEIGASRRTGAAAAEWLRLQNELVVRVKQYEAVASRSERRQRTAPGEPALDDVFDEAIFRHAATQALGKSWLALDYYLTADACACVALTPEDCVIRFKPFPPRLQRALDVATRPRQDSADVANCLAALAEALLPGELLDDLAPGSTLIISPHRQLHHLPWAALPWQTNPAAASAPLVTRCVPLLTPSLHSFTLLQQRGRHLDGDRRHGCVVAVSEFSERPGDRQGERHAPLPEVLLEAATLEAQMGGNGRVLVDGQATWDGIRELGQTDGLSTYAFLHIASHAFFDAVTGRASGLALYDRDIWLDELWQLAPLPALVSLSACSGMQNYLYEGDEAIGLATTCLQAGAQQVVGSLWPVRDAHAAEITTSFYEYVFAGDRPALALAKAQRQAIAAGATLSAWAPFVCVGVY